jgi:hypothetical protein
MKVFPFKIPKPEQSALVFQEDLELVFYDKLHQHEEIQISLIVEGEGTLIVGDTINNYKKSYNGYRNNKNSKLPKVTSNVFTSNF